MSEGLRRVLMERMARGGKVRVRHYGYGGDVDGGSDEGVGGSDTRGGDNPSGDYGGFEGDNGGSYGNDAGSDTVSNDSPNTGARAGDFSGYGDYDFGDFSDFQNPDNYDTSGLSGQSDGFGGYGDSEFGPGGYNLSENPYGGFTFGDFSAFEDPNNYDTSLAGLSDDYDGGPFGGLTGGIGGIGMGLDGMGGNAFNADRDAVARAESDVDISAPDVPDTPTPGVDPDAGLNAAPESALADLAATAASLPQPASVTEEPDYEDPRGLNGLPSTMTVNFDKDPFNSASLARPDVRTMAAMMLDENRGNYGKYGDSALQGPGLVAMNRSLDPAYRARYGDDVTDQITARSQFSGFNIAGVPQHDRISRVVDENPALTDHAYGLAKDIISGITPDFTFGATRLDGPTEYGRVTGPAVNYGGQMAWDRSPEAERAYADLGSRAMNRDQVAGDEAPGTPADLQGWSPEYVGAVAPGTRAQAYDGIPEGDYTPDDEEAVSGLPTPSEQYSMIDVVPTFAQPFAEPTYTRDRRQAEEFTDVPYGVGSTLGQGPFVRDMPAQEVPGPTMPGTQYAGDAVPTGPVSSRVSPPASLTTPAVPASGLPTTLDIGPLEAALNDRRQNYRGFNPDGSFPERGVVQQPTNAMFGPATKALDIVAGLTPLGSLNTLGALGHAIGIPGVNSIGGYAREHAVPGIDMSLGNELHQSDGLYSSAYGSGSKLGNKPIGGKTDGVSQPVVLPPPVVTSGPDYKRRYTPPTDVLHYGYHPEQVMFKAKGGSVKGGDLAERVKHYRAVLEGSDVLD